MMAARAAPYYCAEAHDKGAACGLIVPLPFSIFIGACAVVLVVSMPNTREAGAEVVVPGGLAPGYGEFRLHLEVADGLRIGGAPS